MTRTTTLALAGGLGMALGAGLWWLGTGDVTPEGLHAYVEPEPSRFPETLPESVSPALKKARFVERFGGLAGQSEGVTRVPRLFALAQAALETGWGGFVPGNMLFGIKARGWSGARQLLRTTEYHSRPDVVYPVLLEPPVRLPNGLYQYRVKDWFRAYPTLQASFEDHARLLRKLAPGAFATTDPYAFAAEVARRGYATSPTYLRDLSRIMRDLAARMVPPALV